MCLTFNFTGVPNKVKKVDSVHIQPKLGGDAGQKIYTVYVKKEISCTLK